MKKLLLFPFVLVLMLVLVIVPARSAELTYATPAPQTADSELTIAHKNAANISTLANGYSLSHIATNATTAVKATPGTLHSITVNTKGATANVATVYDNTAGSGTVIAIIDTTAGPSTFVYDVKFGTGLTIVTATGTAADITIAYK